MSELARYGVFSSCLPSAQHLGQQGRLQVALHCRPQDLHAASSPSGGGLPEQSAGSRGGGSAGHHLACGHIDYACHGL
jgi:hypothetical protein